VRFDGLQEIVFHFPPNTSSDHLNAIDDLKSQVADLVLRTALQEMPRFSETSGDYDDTINSLKEDNGTTPGL
jgi:hypothetical protein